MTVDTATGIGFGRGNFIPTDVGVSPYHVVLDNGFYNAFPSLTRAPNGTLFVVYRQGTSHFGVGDLGVLRLQTSTDDGISFGAGVTIANDGVYDIRGGQISRLSSGRLICNFWRRIDGGLTIVNGCKVMYSDDNGVNWSAPALLPDGFLSFSATEGPSVQLADGSLVMPVYGTDVLNTHRSSKILHSADSGVTWTVRAVMQDGPTDVRSYNEPNISLLSDGTLVAMSREGFGGSHWSARSYDDGLTWTPSTLAFAGSGAPHMCVLDGDRILVLYRDDPTDTLNARVSDDAGVTWSGSVQVAPSATQYGSPVVMPDANQFRAVASASASASNARLLSFHGGVT